LGYQPGGSMPAAAAPAAAKSDADIAAAGNLIKTPREQGNYLNQEFDDRSFDRSPVAPGGSEAPRTKVAAPSSAEVQGGADNRLSKFPAAAPVAVARPVPTPVLTKTDGDQNAERDAADAAALAQIKANAGLAGPSAIPSAGSQMGPGGLSAAPPPAEGLPVAVKDPLAPVDSGSLGRAASAGVAAAAPASTSDPEEFIRDKSDDKFDPIKKRKLADPVPGVAAIQELLNSLGMTDAQGNRLRPDGVWGHRSQEAKEKFFKKFKYDSPEDKRYMELLQKVPKSYWTTVVPDAKGQIMKSAGPGASNADQDAARAAASSAPAATGNASSDEEPPKVGFVKKLPGVKDFMGRQVWQKQDGLLAGFDPVGHRMHHITEKNPLLRDPNAATGNGNKLELIGKDNLGRDVYRYSNGRFGAWDADNRKMIIIDAPASQATVVNESSDIQRMRFLAGLTGK